DKLQRFNAGSGLPDAVLLPNRFEMFEGTKSYIDFTIDGRLYWNDKSVVDVGGAKFAEFSNPHTGLYCLSQAQLRRWNATGRTWQDEVLIVGPLESAATYCLLEAFALYKPHPANLHYLECRHHDTKYSQLDPKPSPYRLTPTEPVAV
ncbi:MAG TPA: hypothetical protein VK324_03060, partial [Tepidisphaeraceae bacterium]|nr:hypothetical protein [Tepidisphaeraceae bacterium]